MRNFDSCKHSRNRGKASKFAAAAEVAFCNTAHVKPWREYEERAAAFFRDLGMKAETNVKVRGARGKHKIDVEVKLERFGIEQTWIVECKQWKRRVSKLHVNGLVNIVNDVGADRGFLLCEVGFQKGAIRQARKTNITLTTLASLRTNAVAGVAELGLDDARQRIARLRHRLTVIDNRDRETTPGSGYWVRSDENLSIGGRVAFAETALQNVYLERWPLLYAADYDRDVGIRAADREELADGLQSLLDDLESQAAELEAVISRQPDLG
jgi:hypothetical protein